MQIFLFSKSNNQDKTEKKRHRRKRTTELSYNIRDFLLDSLRTDDCFLLLIGIRVTGNGLYLFIHYFIYLLI